jgi:hypothetical protein
VTRALTVAALLGALLGTARGDEPLKIRPSATVEVIDDKAQIDDVISRLKSEPPKKAAGADELRANRLPPPPANDKDLKRTAKAGPPNRVRRDRIDHHKR